MGRTSAKVAVSLDPGLLAHAERLRASTGESRSALVGRALRCLLRDEAHARDVKEYVEAYRRVPESAEDERAARSLARRSLAALPWDEG